MAKLRYKTIFPNINEEDIVIVGVIISIGLLQLKRKGAYPICHIQNVVVTFFFLKISFFPLCHDYKLYPSHVFVMINK